MCHINGTCHSCCSIQPILFENSVVDFAEGVKISFSFVVWCIITYYFWVICLLLNHVFFLFHISSVFCQDAPLTQHTNNVREENHHFQEAKAIQLRSLQRHVLSWNWYPSLLLAVLGAHWKFPKILLEIENKWMYQSPLHFTEPHVVLYYAHSSWPRFVCECMSRWK